MQYYCPKCRLTLSEVGSTKGGFSVGKAAVGAYLFGPVGLAAGGLGRNRRTYRCPRCGYEKTV